ncbi:16S rRNA (guanine(966)-N(2))-methyltransferase RsmD [Campylobacter geochelonis]|uniref:16S rRNA (guanine(966)-N(2))-methyltransferase RsmD n=1 Tax=Campylobacter geochelonis TaxID=1780362 RepID=UPI00077076C2|nr:16S rRNA (guanine(966)-N(2))-methyltransferase RsmD [Campylobacter geochelonis]CZE48276.1 putative methyltransferase [Campylobacter geochelonis]
MAKLYTTINSGFLKGKKLELPSSATTRSTKAIVKGSFFDSFRDEIRGRVFIEVFGGSGSMAAEALSNGAKMAYAIEKDKDAYTILRRNFSALSENLVAINGDSFKKIDELKSIKDELIIYIDPPFSIRDGFEDVYEKVINLVLKFEDKDVFIVVIEHMSSVEFSQNIGKFSLLKSKRFGTTTLTYYVK